MNKTQEKMNQIHVALLTIDFFEFRPGGVRGTKAILLGPEFRRPDEPMLVVPLFPFGKIVATPGVLAAVSVDDCVRSLLRHATGDWGEIDEEDRRENVRSLEEGFRIMSVYRTGDGMCLWIITEADRSVTTLLLPDEY